VASIALYEGDITEQQVDAIVNAANTELVLGSGVAGAIRQRGGPSIQAECDAHGPVELGGAAITGSGDLAARYVIHAASMRPGGQANEASVRDCVRHSLELAVANGCESVALPAIGVGVGGFPLQRCAEASLAAARKFIAADAGSLREIRFVLFGEPAFRVFEMVNDAAKVAAQMEKLEQMARSKRPERP
jgi:O-acetyl-ADP-ribose deacetylase (regulator of RNase III)